MANSGTAPRSGPSRSILLVDDSAPLVAEVTRFLEASGIGPIESVPSAEAALERLARGGVDVVVMDVGLPGLDGLEATRRLRSDRACPAGIVILTFDEGAEYADAARRSGADAFVPKRTMSDRLVPAIERALASARIRRQR